MGRQGGEDDMDSKVAKWLLEGLRVAAILIPGIVYLERRMAHFEMVYALQEERSKVNTARLDRLDADTSARILGGVDGGFSDPRIRGLLNGTIREQTKELAGTVERLRTEQERILRQLLDLNKAIANLSGK